MLTMKAVHNRRSKALRFLPFDWIQDPEEVLNEKLKTVGLESEYLETDLKLFEVFRKKLCWSLDREYYPLLDLVVPAHFKWQITVMWLLIKCRRPMTPLSTMLLEQYYLLQAPKVLKRNW